MKILPLGNSWNNVPTGIEFDNPSSFLQTPLWAEFKSHHGWMPYYFSIESDNSLVFSRKLLVVLVRFFFRIFSIAYIPLGPDIFCTEPGTQTQILCELSAQLRHFLPVNTLCIRFDPPWGTIVPNVFEQETGIDTISFPKQLLKPIVVAPVHIQPPDTVILDLTKPLDMLLSEMKSKWRYNIKLSDKKGLHIRYLEGEQGSTEGINLFYALFIETAQRDGIAIHSKAYYQDLMCHFLDDTPQKKVSVRVYLAEHENEVIASIITLFLGSEAVYLYGASSNDKRNYMPTYGLQWRAIVDAKAAGCTRYDLYGIPPSDDPSHPMHGLYRFKTGFGGNIIHRVGSVDFPLRPIMYAIYRVSERMRAVWYKKIVKYFKREIHQKS